MKVARMRGALCIIWDLFVMQMRFVEIEIINIKRWYYKETLPPSKRLNFKTISTLGCVSIRRV